MTSPTPDDTDKFELQMRQLALVDRIIGLEAQVAYLKTSLGGEAFKKQLKEVHASTTWKVGRLVLSPLFALRRLSGRKAPR